MGVAIVTGKISGIIVLDVDPRNGGHDTMQGKDLPPTVTVKTGGGGQHYYFKYPANMDSIKNVKGENVDMPGIDIKGDGGYVFAPPSIHPSGHGYEFYDGMEPWNFPLADPPPWLLEIISNGQIKPGVGKADWKKKVKAGSRNNEITRLAGSLLTKMDPEDVLSMLDVWNKTHCEPPLPRKEVEAIVKSISEREQSKPKPRTDTGNAERLMEHYGEQLKYCHAWHKWLYWDGTRWCIDEQGEVTKMAIDTVRRIHNEVANVEDKNERIVLSSHAHRSENHNKLKSMLEVAKDFTPISPGDIDQEKWLISTENKTIDLKNFKVVNHNRDHLITKKIAC